MPASARPERRGNGAHSHTSIALAWHRACETDHPDACDSCVAGVMGFVSGRVEPDSDTMLFEHGDARESQGPRSPMPCRSADGF